MRKEGLITAASIVSFIAVLAGVSSTKFLGEGKAAVITRAGQLVRVKKDAGIAFVTPLWIGNFHRFDVRTKVGSTTVEAASKDNQLVKGQVSYNYHIDRNYIEYLYLNVGQSDKEVEKILINQNGIIEQCFKSQSINYKADAILINRNKLAEDTKNDLNERLNKYGIIIDEFNVANLTFSPEYDKAIEEKQIAEQGIQTAEYNQKAAKITAETEVIKTEQKALEIEAMAKGEANAVETRANAEAKSAKIIAEGKAEANRILTDNLTEMLIKYYEILNEQEAIQKWDGKMPYVTSGATPFLDVNEYVPILEPH